MLRALIALSLLTTVVHADTSAAPNNGAQTWSEIEAEAQGGTVNWFMWGGSDSINRYVSDYISEILMRDHGITLNRIGVSDAAEVVNLVLSEKEAGITSGGAVDLVWINGENFRAMREADLASCGYTDILPNNSLIDWNNPAVSSDFGVPVEGCEMPWNTVQFAFAHYSATVVNPPKSMAELFDWIKANPGRFTHPAPPDFTGSAFVRHVFIHAAGGHEALRGPLDRTIFDRTAANSWAILTEIEPFLWREGQSYPTTVVQLNELFASGEVSFTFNYDPAQFGLAVDAGIYPDTTRSFGLTDGTLGNTNYTLIPFNATNKAAAMVLQNLLLSPEAQLEKARPEVWGAAPAIDPSRADPAVQRAFSELPVHPSVVSAAALAPFVLPELQADWLTAIEAGWRVAVGG